MLHIPSRNVIMEEKYDKLKQLWKEYNETLEAIKNWETIHHINGDKKDNRLVNLFLCSRLEHNKAHVA